MEIPSATAVGSEVSPDPSAWIGRTELRRDVVTAAPAQALAATLDDGNPVPAFGQPLPPLWHWLYFLPRPRRSELGPDGHAARGGFLPPIALPRRMWAGGRVDWRDPLRIGDEVERESRVVDVSSKNGKTGRLVFVQVRHTLSTARGIALVEEHDIVYRDSPAPGATPSAAPLARADAAWSERVVPDDVLLFRYSALTFNGHRIHYDRRYANEVEGYAGLIVHGPLIATLLVELLRARMPDARIGRFAFRAVSPLFDLAPFDVCGRLSETVAGDGGTTVDLWATNANGGLAMEATAHLA